MIGKLRDTLFPVYFVLFLDNFGFAIIFAIFGPLFNNPEYGMVTDAMSSGLRNVMLSFAYIVFPLGQFFGSPFLGDIADQFGRKKAFYITITGTTLGYLFTGLFISFDSYFLLVLSRLLTGFFAGNLSICLASIADLSPDEKSRSKNFAMIVIVTGISWMLAMLIGGYLSDPRLSSHFGPSLPFYLTSAFSAFSLIGIAAWFSESYVTHKKFELNLLKGFKNIIGTFYIKELRVLYLMYLLWIMGWGLAFQWFSPFSLEHFKSSLLEVTWGQFIFGFTWMIGGYFLNNYLTQYFHARPIVIVGTGITTLGLVGMSFAPSYLIFAAIMTLTCLPAAFTWPNTLNLISMNAPENIQGKIMGISQSSMSVGFIIATIIGAFFGGNNRIVYLYPITAVALFFSFLLLLWHHFYLKAEKNKSKG